MSSLLLAGASLETPRSCTVLLVVLVTGSFVLELWLACCYLCRHHPDDCCRSLLLVTADTRSEMVLFNVQIFLRGTAVYLSQ